MPNLPHRLSPREVAPPTFLSRLTEGHAAARLLVCGLVAFAFSVPASAQPITPGVFFSRSVSGQFVVQATPASVASPLLGFLENDTNFVHLDPTLLAVSCEHIKQILWHQLDVTTPWSGKIFLRLYPAGSVDDPARIDSEQFRDGWRYGVSLPNLIQRERYVRAIVGVLLLEYANRRAAVHTAELPTWLLEGLARQIFITNEREVILTPPHMSGSGLRLNTMLVNARRESPLERAHQQLCAGSPLSFQDLSWPTSDQLSGQPGELYRSSAMLFVHQLLALPQGGASLRAMLEDLPRYYNWQFAFLHAFHDTFQKPVDVEKWWSLQLVHFTGRELAQNWPLEESWQKLDELVRSAVQIRFGTNELPLHAEVTLQTIIRDWPQPRQTQALETKLSELQMLRPRLARELAVLVDDYCRAIETYVQNLNHPGFVMPFRKHAFWRRNADEAIVRLDALDARRAGLHPTPVPGPVQADLRSPTSP